MTIWLLVEPSWWRLIHLGSVLRMVSKTLHLLEMAIDVESICLMGSTSPRYSRILMHMKWSNSLPGLVNWVHHVSINMSINEYMCSILIIKGTSSRTVSAVIIMCRVIIWRIILERWMCLTLLVWWSISWVWMVSVIRTSVVRVLWSTIIHSYRCMVMTRLSRKRNMSSWVYGYTTIERWLGSRWIFHILIIISILIILNLLFVCHWMWIVLVLIVILIIGCWSCLIERLRILWSFVEVLLLLDKGLVRCLIDVWSLSLLLHPCDDLSCLYSLLLHLVNMTECLPNIDICLILIRLSYEIVAVLKWLLLISLLSYCCTCNRLHRQILHLLYLELSSVIRRVERWRWCRVIWACLINCLGLSFLFNIFWDLLEFICFIKVFLIVLGFLSFGYIWTSHLIDILYELFFWFLCHISTPDRLSPNQRFIFFILGLTIFWRLLLLFLAFFFSYFDSLLDVRIDSPARGLWVWFDCRQTI